MQPYLSASLPGVSAAIRKAICEASNWEDLHFLVKPGMAEKPGMVIGQLGLVAPRPIVRGWGGE